MKVLSAIPFAIIAGLLGGYIVGLTTPTITAQSPTPSGERGGIELPEIQPVPQPMPTPVPMAVTKLNAAEMYVVQSDAPFVVRSFPDGLVTITNDAGPVKIKGQFAGGNGKIATKTFSKKQVTIVEACGAGRVALDIIPVGFKTEKDIVRVVLDVDSGTGPQPPPIDPITPLSPLAKTFKAAYDADPAPNKAELLGKLTGVMEGVPSIKASGKIVTDKQFVDTIRTATDLSVGVGKLSSVRKAAGEYLNTTLGQIPLTVNDEYWTKQLAAYSTIAKALREIK